MSTGTTIGKGIWLRNLTKLSVSDFTDDIESIKNFVEHNTKLKVGYISGSECIFQMTLVPKAEELEAKK